MEGDSRESQYWWDCFSLSHSPGENQAAWQLKGGQAYQRRKKGGGGGGVRGGERLVSSLKDWSHFSDLPHQVEGNKFGSGRALKESSTAPNMMTLTSDSWSPGSESFELQYHRLSTGPHIITDSAVFLYPILVYSGHTFDSLFRFIVLQHEDATCWLDVKYSTGAKLLLVARQWHSYFTRHSELLCKLVTLPSSLMI